MNISIDNPHVAIVSSPGMGHLLPALVLANRLATHHNANITVLQITTTASPPLESELLRLNLRPDLVRIIELPPVDISHLVTPSTQVVTQLCLMARSALPLIRSALAAIVPRPDALVADLWLETSPIAQELGMAKYLFVPTTAWFTALTIYCPVLDREIDGQYVDRPEPLKIPGCKPVRPEDVVDPMLDRNDQQYHEYVKLGKQYLLFDGILLNTCEDLERETLEALRSNEAWRSILKIPIYPIGPLRRPVEPVDENVTEVIGWLDRQPNESVAFVAFGSGGMLSAEQITELAWGLEMSQQRFVWVVRPPTSGNVDDAYFSIGRGFDGTPNYLPDGFLTRIQGKGLLVSGWAQQARILDHPAVGGFMSHCGWNSVLESITSGVPMVAWPLYAEQRLNAAMLAEEVGVAVRPRVLPTKAVVGREEVESLVRRLMERREMRDKVKQLRIRAMEGLEKGGPSHNAMCEFLSSISLRMRGPNQENPRGSDFH